MDNELFYTLLLSRTAGVGCINGKNLIAHCGSAEQVFKTPKSQLLKIPGIGANMTTMLRNPSEEQIVENEIAFMEKNKIRAILYNSPEFPLRLKQAVDSPLILFCNGSQANLNPKRVLAIVGTRKPTGYGLAFTEQLVAELQNQDVTIISGLAFGIDIAAHKAALQNQIPTFAVVAHGLDLLYPENHKKQADKMAANQGAILSEHFSNTAMHPDLFPRRNRIVAGMADAVLVVESKKAGGSMITAELANDYNRDVFALPGRINDNQSAGCNLLIQQNKAQLCTSASDILFAMDWDNQPKNKKNKQISMFEKLDETEKSIVDVLEIKNQHFDDILIQTKIPVSKLSLLLLDLEMRGIISQFPGKMYGRN